MRRLFTLAAIALFASTASAQIPGLRKRTGPVPPQQVAQMAGVDVVRADFLAHSGGDTIFFGVGSFGLSAPARTALAAQAAWLRQHPEVTARVEGHGDSGDTRDHAIAVGARRAEEVRAYLVLMGIPAAQLSTSSWGKERPGSPRAQTVLVR